MVFLESACVFININLEPFSENFMVMLGYETKRSNEAFGRINYNINKKVKKMGS